jgi:ElaB/YqjD/DUF883 family membrane-anchored ribosome-binding protein
MYSDQLQHWTDNAAQAAGKAYGQGREMFYSARDKAYEAARRAKNARRAEKRAEASLPTLHDRWHRLLDNAGESFARAGSRIGCRFHSSERLLLKTGAVLLALKCFSRRHQPVSAIASDTHDRIRERPVESVIIALGIGYALGKLLR